MRKGAVFILLIGIFVVVASFATAQEVIINCSDESKVDWDENEIDIDSSRKMNGIGVGLISTSSMGVIVKGKGVVQREIAEIIVDASRVALSKQDAEETLALLIGDYTINISNATSTTAYITIDGESKVLEEDKIEQVKGLDVLLTEAESTGDSYSANFLVGDQHVTLTSDANPVEKKTIGNKTYLVELRTTSDSSASLRVSRCLTGEISFVQEQTPEEPANTTSEENTSEETETEKTDDNPTNESTRQVTVAEARAAALNASNTSKTQTEEIDDEEEKKEGFFHRIINAIKRFFGFD